MLGGMYCRSASPLDPDVGEPSKRRRAIRGAQDECLASLMCTLTLVSIIPGTPLAIITFCYVYAPLTLSHVHEFAKREYFRRRDF
jgi:hypothetical protein